ncbi:cupin domain-containing protein [Pandoraea bronchicola]|uniref:Cupin domain-containing protein n=1 Tax=Pandoraea bronchicola TaxID=2508287 RepID=A0A5E5BW58_9BURK|nr:cupin domain-containing protein [Pandoraea bronchicola]VVE89372.1 cupin domain-containing protein [Pandoraea bronchicola]
MPPLPRLPRPLRPLRPLGQSSRSTLVALPAGRTAATLTALGVAAVGLALTPPAQRALPGWFDTLCSLTISANHTISERLSPSPAKPRPTAMATAASGGDGAVPRPGTTVKPLSCEPLANAPGKSVTTAIVEFPPLAFSPPHRHPGAVTAVVLEGTIRSQLNADAPITYHAHQTWFEPPGTLHTMAENPDPVHPARLLAFFVTEENCGPLTIYEPAAAPS